MVKHPTFDHGTVSHNMEFQVTWLHWADPTPPRFHVAVADATCCGTFDSLDLVAPQAPRLRQPRIFGEKLGKSKGTDIRVPGYSWFTY